MGPLRLHWPLPVKPEERPKIERDTPDGWYYLRFDGVRNHLVRGCLTCPPGPATLEMLIRPHETERRQTIMDMWGAAFSLGLDKDGRLSLLREDRERSGVWLTGKSRLEKDRFHHVAAVFDGTHLKLYLNGGFEGSLPCIGLRSNEKMTLGVNCGVTKLYTGRKDAWNRAFKGDVAMFRLLERPFSPDEIRRRAKQSLECMNRGK